MGTRDDGVARCPEEGGGGGKTTGTRRCPEGGAARARVSVRVRRGAHTAAAAAALVL